MILFSNRSLFLFFFILHIFIGFCQSGSYYGNPSDASELCGIRVQTANSFSSNVDAQKALDKIIAVTGISKRFALYQCSGINNCEAITFRGIRYIFYDPAFMKSITSSTGSWTNLSILAHEVGHHVNAHSLDWLALASGEIKPISLVEKRQQELEADEFSGFVLAKLGATLAQAQAAVKLVSDNSDDSYSTHPTKNKRLDAIERGYNQAKVLAAEPYEISTLTAEDYFYIAYNSNDNQVKITNYTKCVQINSGILTAYLNRGYCYCKQKKYTSALSDFDKVIELAKNSISTSFSNYLDDGYQGKGHCYKVMMYENPNDASFYFSKAITEYTNAIIANPNYENYFTRGKLYHDVLYKAEELEQNETTLVNKSLSDFNKSQSLNSNFGETYHLRGNLYEYYLKDLNLALKDYIKWSELEPSEINAFSNQAGIYASLKNYDKSIEKYSKAISIYPDGWLYYLRALSYIELGKFKEANNDLTKSISISKDTTNDSWALVENRLIDIYWDRAYTFEKLDNYNSAILDYNKIIELSDNPGSETYLNRARNYFLNNRNDLAMNDYNKAISIDPNNAKVYMERGYFYQYWLKKETDALKDYSQAILLDDNFIPPYYYRALIYGGQNQPLKAIEDFNKVIRSEENPDAETYFYRGLAYNDLENFSKSILDFNKSIEIDPKFTKSYIQRGVAKMQMGLKNDACEDWQKALYLGDENGSIFLNEHCN
jgi:tetratricopeptide (TPR) repeat protein